MKFLNKIKNQIIWDVEKKCILCRFKDGIFETENEYIIAKLINLKYEYQEEEKINVRSKNKRNT